ncbi:ATP-dependent DNA helicase [Bdellovibrio bacteriovorus]|uniref:DNA 3'-5' helicase n=1 Tax=Bdellovibrio bacteriovorus TaxID=959 RepID=A0A150WP09_BDEBC|nr:UvrD-helicase domain-containing protein [Bdellovibrio bacteriovorus]KYG66160.1 ATP-dependent DNA helicase [Bdellovibrio bacteriovorus]
MDVLDFVTKNLNPSQKDAVETLEGPLLILAGAGSGKTRVLTHRMANIIGQGVAAPDEILCVTFTNKAAKEMEHRIYKILADMGARVHSQLWINTFHSFCVRVLRQHLTLLDYKPFFGIYDSSDQLSQIKKVMTALDINDKMYPAKNFQGAISRAKMLGLNPDAFEKERKNSRHFADAKTIEVYKLYEKEMKKANSLDFDDLLLKTYELFRMYPDVLQMYQEKFKYIMVDEYQDTNHIQYLIVQMLAQAHRNLCVVGDEDQSIYSWRGADIKNILDFEKDFREAKVVKLEENYRSSGNIVGAATAVIKNNSERKDKTLFTSNPAGDKIQVREERNEYDEAKFVAKTIQTMMNEGEGSYNDYAIFYRTNAQSRVLEEQLRTLSIPYRLVGGVRFYERMEIKDMLSYMKLAINPADDVAFKRVINVPARGIGKTTVEKIEEFAFQQNLSMMQAALKACEERVFNAGTTGKVRRFVELMGNLQELALKHPLVEFYPIVLDMTEYLVALKKDESPESLARIDNLEELDNAIVQFAKERGEEGTLTSFLEEMALVSDVDSLNQEQNSVTMMTLHISKGLEYPYVFVVGLEENLFPSARSLGDGDTEEDVQEERRLAYVGMTRARQKLWLTYAKMRRVWGQEQFNPQSRFIKEIPQEYIEFKTAAADAPRFMAKYGSSSYDSDETWGRPQWGATSGSRNKPRSYEDESQSFPDYDDAPASSGGGFSKGMRVRHPTFGAGTVYATEGEGENFKVSVMFTDNTVKKFVVKYARLEKI